MANTILTQSGQQVQADLDLTEHIQDEFSSSSTYAVGALVIYNTKIYRCHTAVSSAGAWTGSTNWTEQKLSDLLNLKQDTLTFDNAPTSASTNPVTSGGVYTALSNKQDSNTVLTSVASQSSGTGLLKLTNGVASLDTNSYLTSHLYRPIKVDGVQKLADNVNTALDLVAGTNITLSESDGAVTINASGGGSYDLATTQDINRLFETEYTIITSVTNGTYTGDTSIWTSETATVTVSADTGYELPATITVTGASYTYNQTTGVIVLSNVTGNVSISVVCESAAVGYSGSISKYGDVYYGGVDFATKIKFDTAPTSDNDYDACVTKTGVFTGSTSYTSKSKVYVWPNIASAGWCSVKINEVETKSGDGDYGWTYERPFEINLTGNYTIYLGYYDD